MVRLIAAVATVGIGIPSRPAVVTLLVRPVPNAQVPSSTHGRAGIRASFDTFPFYFFVPCLCRIVHCQCRRWRSETAGRPILAFGPAEDKRCCFRRAFLSLTKCHRKRSKPCVPNGNLFAETLQRGSHRRCHYCNTMQYHCQDVTKFPTNDHKSNGAASDAICGAIAPIWLYPNG